MDYQRITIIILLMLSSVLALALTTTETIRSEGTTANKNIDVTENIRLYSDGQLIGEWTGIGRGSMVGNTYVFKIDKGQFSREIRIKGDFVIERHPN